MYGMMKKKHFIQFLMFLNFVLYHLINNAFWKCLRLRKSTWNFWEVNFRSRDFVGFCWKPLGFWGLLIFAPIPSSNLEYPPPTAPPFLFPPPLVSQPNALLDPQEGFCAMILELPLTQQILTRNIYLYFALLSSFAVQTCHLLITQPIFWPEICVTGKV